jgi:2-dehydropantoate 2-reductase
MSEPRDPVRVAVIGAGAVGQLVAALAAGTARADVTLISRRPEVVDEIRAEGLRILDARGATELRSEVRVAVPEEAATTGPYDLVLLLTKCYDVDWAITVGRRLAAADGAVVALQNGLASAAKLERADPRGVAGVIYQGARYVGPGVVERTARGPLQMAPNAAMRARVAELADQISSTDLPVQLCDNRDAMLWEKLVGAVSNSVSGALLLPVCDLSRSASAWQVMERARAEILDIATARGVGLDRSRIVAQFAPRPVVQANLGSTYQSLVSGRQSEVPEISGEVEALGIEARVATPVNSALRLLVLAREELMTLTRPIR